MATTAAGDHSDELADFGYKQELDRSIGRFASFAAGVSYISILTGVFQLFYFGFAFGGPAYWWTWPMVFAGQLMVALCFAELAANFPVAGSITSVVAPPAAAVRSPPSTSNSVISASGGIARSDRAPQ